MDRALHSRLSFQPLKKCPRAGHTRQRPDMQWVRSRDRYQSLMDRSNSSRGFCIDLRATSRGLARVMLAHPEDVLMVTRSLVSVVDDDESVRESLPDML